MFHLDVASVLCGCCKRRSRCCIFCNGCARILQAFIPNISVVFLDVRCKCFTHMLYVFYLNAAYVFNGFFKRFHVFLQVFQTYVASVSTVFERMLQTFYLDVLKVD
jgi:hypothetical protein